MMWINGEDEQRTRNKGHEKDVEWVDRDIRIVPTTQVENVALLTII